MKPVNVIKASGAVEPFAEQKVLGSLQRAGAASQVAAEILEQVKPHLYPNIPSFEIYNQIMRLLKKKQRSLAERYDLKRAIMDLGPTGYPFEKFFAQVLRESGYQVSLNQVVVGRCVAHEVDVVAMKGERKFMVECKFHNQPGAKTDIKVALYVYARFLDLKHQGFTQAWLVSNTKLTNEVKSYAACVGLQVTAWNYPEKASLSEMIDRTGLHPITASVSLTGKQKQSLLEQGIIFCRDWERCQALGGLDKTPTPVYTPQ